MIFKRLDMLLFVKEDFFHDKKIAKSGNFFPRFLFKRFGDACFGFIDSVKDRIKKINLKIVSLMDAREGNQNEVHTKVITDYECPVVEQTNLTMRNGAVIFVDQ
jgi:hypothetical protein